VRKYRFLEALEKVKDTTQRIRPQGGRWSSQWNKVGNDDGRPFLKTEAGYKWWPSLEDQKAEIWEVEPEEIYVWGVCDNDGKSYIYKNKPRKTETIWEETRLDNLIGLASNNLFPTDKPQKFKLVPVED